MKFYRYPLALFTLLLLLGCPPRGGTEEQRKQRRTTGPCADSLFIALKSKDASMMTQAENLYFQQAAYECENWVESGPHTSTTSSGWTFLLIPVFALVLGLSLAFSAAGC